MQKILFPIGEKELSATQGRLLHIPDALAMSGYAVDILTYNDEGYSKAVDVYKNNDRVNVKITKARKVAVLYSFRDDLLKTFIKQTHHLFIPGTDVRLYKLTAFDDFWGHIESYTYPDIDVSKYNLILMPLPSDEDVPPPECNAFYSAICFMAKEKTIPLVGLQLYPVVHTPPVFIKTMDYFIVKEEHERKYLKQWGMTDEKIYLLTDEKEAYYLSTIEDTYKNLMINSGVDVAKNEICIVIINHPKFRAFIRDILIAVGRTDIPKIVLLMKRGYNVKELKEEDIINDIYMDVIKKIKGRAYIIDSESTARLLMVADIVVSPSYITPLKFAATYNKLSIVYNPLYKDTAYDDKVVFIDETKKLEDAVISLYNKKIARTYLSDIAAKLFK